MSARDEAWEAAGKIVALLLSSPECVKVLAAQWDEHVRTVRAAHPTLTYTQCNRVVAMEWEKL